MAWSDWKSVYPEMQSGIESYSIVPNSNGWLFRDIIFTIPFSSVPVIYTKSIYGETEKRIENVSTTGFRIGVFSRVAGRGDTVTWLGIVME